MEDLLKAFVQLAMFSAFIHAIVEVIKGISAGGVFGIIKGLFMAIFKNQNLDPNAIRTFVFVLALVYCWGFDYDAMTDILKVDIPETNILGWWLAYIGTAAVVYVGVDVFYGWFKKTKASLTAIEAK